MTNRIPRTVLALIGSAAAFAVLAGSAPTGRHPSGTRLWSLTASRPSDAPATPLPTAGRVSWLRDPRLLAAGELPLLVDGTDVWQETAGYADHSQSSDIPCLRGALDRLGARAQAYRTYRQATRPGGKYDFYYAAHLVADFPDGAAPAAAATIDGWIRDCARDGSLPGATVTAHGPGQWSITSATPGPDRNKGLPATARTESEFTVQQRGTTVSVLYVGAETADTVPWGRMQAAAGRAAARL
ncbi:hypothetical protein [Kitasatospora aureofaciens]|uniref:hypothetical protein n=1 Tax=Kitasatospora aureofaciens TaxID=1894 RepID=UPI001C46B2EF|nr:hypothetical protein [Kitasatospora aureofaciens]MBV6699823.1 hypothetical protein [Kitasatospora aureofaciens]